MAVRRKTTRANDPFGERDARFKTITSEQRELLFRPAHQLTDLHYSLFNGMSSRGIGNLAGIVGLTERQFSEQFKGDCKFLSGMQEYLKGHGLWEKMGADLSNFGYRALERKAPEQGRPVMKKGRSF